IKIAKNAYIMDRRVDTVGRADGRGRLSGKKKRHGQESFRGLFFRCGFMYGKTKALTGFETWFRL
ncbi:MAG TPA: hypothetical protein VMZ06_18380, partial [Candidatus Bathyarchaeia archaeon]|nr:hypothetical protein [Candidatus Bathyarchaeia archaeon]